jgi:hypothetical protein
MVLDAHAAVTPAGKPVGAPMPVAPVVAMVILVKAVLMHTVGEEDGAPAAFVGVTVKVATGEEIICEHVPLGELITTSKSPALPNIAPEIVNVAVFSPE